MERLAVTVKMPISRTKTELKKAFRPQNSKGFTLVELLVVIAIAALLIGVVPFAYQKMHEASQYRTALRTVLTDLRTARQMAIAEGRSVAYKVELGRKQIGIEGRTVQQLPENLQLRATVAQEQVKDGNASILFLPTGGATGGSLEIIRSNGEGARLRVDWFSGQISQERLLP